MAKMTTRPTLAFPSTVPPHEAGLTWRYLDSRGEKVCTVHASAVYGGMSADFPARDDLGDAMCLGVGGGLPALPLTDPEADHPLSFAQVCAEVEARLEKNGWAVFEVALAGG